MYITEQLRQAMKNLLKYSKNEAGLIMRWNNKDSLIKTVWSEGYKDVPGAVKHGYNRAPIKRIDLKKGGFVESSSQPFLGGHAEEIMIRNWESYKKYDGEYPKIVDIILTHSPCLDQSGLFVLKGHQWPVGCAPKLKRLITVVEKEVREWHIGYFAYYGNQASVTKAKDGIWQLDRIKNVNTYYFHTIP